MGSECSVYKDYELEEPIKCSSTEWTLYPAHSKGNSPVQRVTVFVHKKTKQERKQTAGKQSVTNTYQFLKVLRHPAILKYYSSYESSEVVVVTEPVEPLETVLESLDEDEIVAGLNNIVQALSFLHEKGGLSHNNVCLSSIYVSNNDGSWKLGGMQCVCKPEQFNKQFIQDIKPLRSAKSVAPEEKDEKVAMTTQTVHTIDAYGFGTLVNAIIDIRDDIGDSTFSKFIDLIQNSFIHSNPQARPKLSSLLEEDFFKNDYVEILTFLNNITIKSDIDKDKFFSTLASKLRSISSNVVATRLLPKLMSRFVMAEPSAEKEFLPHLLVPGTAVIEDEAESFHPILPLDLFKQYCVPILFKLWTIKDLHIRIILLNYFPLFAKAFEIEDLEKTILPQILIGLRDTDDTLVSATFHALANLVPILGGAVVVGGERQKYFKEGRPKFSLGSSPQINEHRKPSIGETGIKNSKKKSLLNVSDALNMERTPESLPRSKTEYPAKTVKVKPESKQKIENNKRIRKEKAVIPKSESLETNPSKTLLALAKKHSVSVNETDTDGVDKEIPPGPLDNDDEDTWDDFQMGDFTADFMESNSPDTKHKEKASPTLLTPTSWSTTNYDISDVDFTQRRQSQDLITWDNEPQVSQPKPSSGKAMKLGSKKQSAAKPKPKPNPNNLGQMFELPDINVKSQEPDFFADMQPNVQFKSYDGSIGGTDVKSAYSKTLDVSAVGQVEDNWEVEDWSNFE